MNDNEKYLEKLKTHRRHLHQIPEIDSSYTQIPQ